MISDCPKNDRFWNVGTGMTTKFVNITAGTIPPVALFRAEKKRQRNNTGIYF